jgi:hypothetical protein
MPGLHIQHGTVYKVSTQANSPDGGVFIIGEFAVPLSNQINLDSSTWWTNSSMEQ